MNVDSYSKMQSALLRGCIDECNLFLTSRHQSDKGSAEYWYWLAQFYYRSGRPLQALDICFKLTREAGVFAMHFHCLADICAHLGAKEIGVSGIDMLASKSEFGSNASYYVRLAGNHYLGEDETALQLNRACALPISSMNEHFRARSEMRSHGITAGVHTFYQTYCSRDAVSELWPTQDIERYWCGQRELPRRLTIKGFSCGFGDFIQWIRYARVLQALCVEIYWDAPFNGLLGSYEINDHDHQFAGQLKAAGFVRGCNEMEMWTSPFALFASLFPVLGYCCTGRYIESYEDAYVERIVNEIRQRAQGRKCIGIFWSSCESNNLYASRSLRDVHLGTIWEHSEDIHWVIMQRGYERTRWENGSYSKDSFLSTGLPEFLSLVQTIRVIDQLDGFVGNDGVLSHVTGALNKPGYLLLNARCADWRYERSSDMTPWYPSIQLIRPEMMGDWEAVVTTLASRLKG
jgi:hypothetical protein